MTRIAIITNEKDALYFLHSKPISDDIYPLTPNTFNLIKNDKSKKIINPLKINFDEIHKNTILEVSKIEKLITNNVNQNNEINNSSKEFIIFQANVYLSSYSFLFFSLNKYKIYEILINNKWKIFSDLGNIINTLYFKLFNENFFNHHFPLYSPNNQLFKPLIRINNFLVKFLINRKNLILSTGTNFGMGKLNSELCQNNTENLVFLIKPSFRYSFLETFKYFLLLNPFNKNRTIEFIPVYSKKVNYSDIIYKIFKDIDNKLFSNAKNNLLQILIDGINYIENTENYLYNFLKTINIKCLLAHQLRLSDAVILASIANKRSINSFLISHGIHPIENDKIAELALRSNARGMIYSCLATHTIVQSKISNISAKRYMKNIIRLKTMPLMWGRKSINFENISKRFLNEKIILHASTFKSYSVRPWIFESPFEYIKGLNKLILAMKKLPDIKLIIRVRPTNDCSISAIKENLPSSPNVLIKTGNNEGSFLEDLKLSTMLISYSSTTIEEALYEKIPAALYGGSERFRGYKDKTSLDDNCKNRQSIYHLFDKNLDTRLRNIIDNHYNDDLKDHEVDNIIWTSKDKTQDNINELFR